MVFAPPWNCLRGCNGDRESPVAHLRSCLHLRNAQFRNSKQVVRGTGNEGRHLGLRLADETGLSQSADRFQPTEGLRDALSLAAPAALGPGGSPLQAGWLPILALSAPLASRCHYRKWLTKARVFIALVIRLVKIFIVSL